MLYYQVMTTHNFETALHRATLARVLYDEGKLGLDGLNTELKKLDAAADEQAQIEALRLWDEEGRPGPLKRLGKVARKACLRKNK